MSNDTASMTTGREERGEEEEEELQVPLWERPSPADKHAHFDCFSGAAGDMMLAACLDAAGDDQAKKVLLKHVVRSLECGLPELEGEFSLSMKRVWRGMGSVAANYVMVGSKYHHKAAPVPKKKQDAIAAVHDHNHDHSHSHSHSHSHNHSHNHSHSHDHSHSHSHDYDRQSSATSDPHPTEERDHSHTHSHESSSSAAGPLRNLPEIRQMLQDAPTEHISPWVSHHAIRAFTLLAEAEAHTHGAASPDDVHFHEVGAVDSIVDTVGTLVALHALGVTTVSCSRLPLGEGTVWTDHGLLPVPAPATLRLLVDLPTCPGPPGVTGELVTPTAAALLKALVQKSSSPKGVKIAGRPPAFTIRSIGIGAGTKDFDKHPNILRLLLGDSVVVDGAKKQEE